MTDSQEAEKAMFDSGFYGKNQYIGDSKEGKYLNFNLCFCIFLVFKLTGPDKGRSTANNESIVSCKWSLLNTTKYFFNSGIKLFTVV